MLSISLRVNVLQWPAKPQMNCSPFALFSTSAILFLGVKHPSLQGLCTCSTLSSWNAFPQISCLIVLAWQEEENLGSHSNRGIMSRERRRTIPLTLKAQIFPVISVEGTVKLGAGQLLVDGLEYSAMQWVLAIQATCPKTHHALYWIASQRMVQWRQIQTMFKTSCSPLILPLGSYSLSQHGKCKTLGLVLVTGWVNSALPDLICSACFVAATTHSHWAMVRTKSLSSRSPWWSFGGPKRQCRRAASPVLRIVGWILFLGEKCR